MTGGIPKTDAHQTSRFQWKKVEMPFEHSKRVLKLDRLRLRIPSGVRDKSPLAEIAQKELG
ncbi:hypothetical protein N181_04945 [Sinorhizobium fredii USDA 205]|uniref:Uncharacterized protein n=1 Tax=Rhizobium fredii TaxID=380 RepID=A0A844AG67_RHIFR|nr:hypothetical protein [Sinorhizobium fredii]ASY71981.1 hypothetical protein SF83666_b53320 [Sinorhizobium fredii CCBAU 83666]KSV82661.1 hypothetical protein N181_04945 [Sinorhizobium fredii USDA 205]MQX10656.1 hypothetical protein [Sinorhizobium fredii]GEC30924.1 hypothetical protein EFR01_10950 [Sinorhizobium fredii]GLS10476.1 hypothetical protein GCM10007864_41070 [Sinorhizobium fredii]